MIKNSELWWGGVLGLSVPPHTHRAGSHLYFARFRRWIIKCTWMRKVSRCFPNFFLDPKWLSTGKIFCQQWLQSRWPSEYGLLIKGEESWDDQLRNVLKHQPVPDVRNTSLLIFKCWLQGTGHEGKNYHRNARKEDQYNKRKRKWMTGTP